MGTYLGELEALIILACLQIGPEAYAVSIRKKILEKTGRGVSRGTIYVALERLEQKGLLTSHRGEPVPERGGKARRHFQVLPEGIDQLRKSRAAFLAMSEGLDPVLHES